MNKNILIINYNTQNFVDKLIMSINKFVDNANIFVFDNSDKTPYVNTFSNVKIIDNTSGQIINFNKLLEKYPDRIKTSAGKNNYGSAKHCYTVDKCIDIFEDGFILLDSDVLLKRDISGIIKDDKIFVGDTESWKAAKTVYNRIVSPKTRAIPYLCYINTKKCKELGIRYFNDKCMFGLSENGDSYDTGTYFFEEITRKNIDWEKINLNNYIVHYKAASWVEEAKKVDNYKQMSPDNWLNCYKTYWSNENQCIKLNKNVSMVEEHKNKIIIYTCITGGYDIPTDNFEKRDGYEYWIFTDNKDMKVNCWDAYIPQFKDSLNLDTVKKQRFIKTHPHLLFDDFDTVVWVDANTTIDDKLYNYIEKYKDDTITFKKHPSRDCIYDEIKEVCLRGKEIQPICMWLYDRYTAEQYPNNNGLYETNIIISHPNNPTVKFIFENWWKEIFNYSKRDQLSLNYILWKYKLSGMINGVVSYDFPAKPHIKQL